MEAKNSGESSFGNKPRELCPNITTSDDLMHRLGTLSVDILNKEKVLIKLWKSLDESAVNIKSLTDEIQSLNNIKDDNEKTLSTQGERIQSLESEKQSIVESLSSEKESVEKSLNEKIRNLNNNHSKLLSERDSEINKLKEALKGIEAEAVINQEEIRKELMETRNELSILKESIKSKPKGIKKKKTSTKPARA